MALGSVLTMTKSTVVPRSRVLVRPVDLGAYHRTDVVADRVIEREDNDLSLVRREAPQTSSLRSKRECRCAFDADVLEPMNTCSEISDGRLGSVVGVPFSTGAVVVVDALP